MSAPQTVDSTPLLDSPLPPAATDWLGMWPGVVVSTEDPQKLGRVRVRVPQVFGDPDNETDFVPDLDLPWAIPILPVHDYHAAFEPGDGVWVSFWGGNPTFPMWHGQFLGTGDAPAEFVSSYTPTPKTRIMRTTNGHIIEMRWVEGQEKISLRAASGSTIEMLDSPAEGGVKILAQTPGLRKMELSDFPALSRVAIETPTQRIEAIDTPTPVVNINGAGAVNVVGTGAVTVQGQGLALNSTGGAPTTMVGGGTLTSTFTGNAIYTFLGTLAYAVTLALTLASAGLLTISGGTGIAILTSAGLVSLGMAGLKFKLVDTRFLAFFDAHTHIVTTAPGVTGAPQVPSVPLVAVLSTTNTEAN